MPFPRGEDAALADPPSEADVEMPLAGGALAKQQPQPALGGIKGRVACTGVALTLILSIAGVALLLSRSATTQEAVSAEAPDAVVGLAATGYDDLGSGKCVELDGLEPRYTWKGSGNVEAMCTGREDCWGFSASSYGGGLLWLSGPLKSDPTKQWGGCHCSQKKKHGNSALPGVPLGQKPTAPPAGDKDEFPNVHLIASGYNLFYGDPMPKHDGAAGQVNVDPGLRKPVFAIKYDKGMRTGDRRHKRPDGFFASVDYGCSEVFSTKTVSDAYQMSAQYDIDASITDQAGLDICIPDPGIGFEASVGDTSITTEGGRFGAFVGAQRTLSASHKQIKESNLFAENRLVLSSARCAVYQAGINFAHPPETHPDFKKALDAATNTQGWYVLFDNFGTHFMSTVKMGARFGSMVIFQNSQYEAMYEAMTKASLSVGPVVEAGVKMAVWNDNMENPLQVEWAPEIPLLTDVDVVSAKGVKTFNSYASGQVFQGVGPTMPKTGGSGKWMEEVSKNPTPIRMAKMEICMHPGLSKSQREACQKALNTYCFAYLANKGADCSEKEKRECQSDIDCKAGSVCREFKCVVVPICHVTIYDNENYGGGHFILDPVDAVNHAGGKHISLKNMNWHDRISSFKLGAGCDKVYLHDDDPGNFLEGYPQNEWRHSDTPKFTHDLQDDVASIVVYAKPVPGAPQAKSSKPHGKPKPIAFNPVKDVFFVAPGAGGSGLNHPSSKGTPEFFPNIGKAMYGYNHHYGAPLSTQFAGADPGFQPRSVWQVTYTKNIKGREAVWKKMPMAPDARYFVLFAAKHEQISQLQQDAADPCAAAHRYFQKALDDLKAKKQQIADGKMGFYAWKNFEQSMRDKKHWTTPELPVAKKDDKYCSLLHEIELLLETRDQWGTAKFADEYAREEAEWKKLCGGHPSCYYYRRRLQQTEPLNQSTARRLMNVGAIYCKEGKALTWTAEDKKEDEAKRQNGFDPYDPYGYYDDYYYGWRRLSAEPRAADAGANAMVAANTNSSAANAVVPARRLHYLHYPYTANTFFDSSMKPNMREFASLARAKQALRSETQCLGSLRESKQCPSGHDYDLNLKGTKWGSLVDSHNSMYHWYETDPCTELEGKLKAEWPRFIVKVVGDKIDSLDEIDGQNQHKRWKTGFDSQIPSGAPLKNMVQHLEEHLKAHPRDKTVMEPPQPIATKVPDGWRVTRAKGEAYCEHDMKTDIIQDANSYERMTSSSLGIPKTSAAVNDNGFTFGLSYEKKHLLKTQGERQEKMASTQAECATYYAEIEDLANNPPPTDPAFKFLVDGAKTESHMWSIFDLYGLHFTDEVVFGARYGTTQYITSSSFEQYQLKHESLSLDFGVSAAVPVPNAPGVDVKYGVDTSIGYSGTDESTERIKKYFNERRTFSVGKSIPAGGLNAWKKDMEVEPMPIKFSLVPLCKHPAFKAKQALCESSEKTYCEKYLKHKHPEMSCGPTPKAECIWDIDCDTPHTRCQQGICVPLPGCDVKLFSGGNYNGESKVVPAYYYKPNQPFHVVDLNHFGWRGKAKSMIIGGGCSKVIKMSSNALDSGDNYVITNYESNAEKRHGGVRHANWLALYPKEHWAGENAGYWIDAI